MPASRSDSATATDKWQVLRDLTAAREGYELSDRDMTVLQALLSCHPEAQLDPTGPLIVHPSNETIRARAGGMACSTMRRHLAQLVTAGIILRRASPNGKRYARRIADTKIAFGFDLSPLLHRAEEFAGAAEACRRQAAAQAALRDTVSLLRRDLAAMVEYAGGSCAEWSALTELAQSTSRALRRKLSFEALTHLEEELRHALACATDLLDIETPELSTSAARNEQHQQKSNKDLSESEPAAPTLLPDCRATPLETNPAPNAEKMSAHLPPFALIRQACTEIATFATISIRDWPSLVRASDEVRPMTGISETTWHEAKHVMGPERAAATLSAMLQRFPLIRNPGGYLRHLVQKARRASFSPTRMIMALVAETA